MAALVSIAPAAAQGRRDLLTQASFIDRDKPSALRNIQAVVAATERDASFEGRLLRATALGYRAKLTGSRGDLTASKKLFDTAVAVNPRNAEAQMGLGAWHIATLNRTGGLLGRVVGASRSVGIGALDKAVSIGGDRAFYSGLAALLRLKANPKDARGRQLAEAAARAGAPTPLDKIMQRAARAVLVPLRAGQTARTRATAQRLLPFGTFSE